MATATARKKAAPVSISLDDLSVAATKKSASKKDKTVVKVDATVAKAIDEYVTAEAEIAAAEAVKSAAETTIKQYGKKYVVTEQLGKGAKVESVILASTDNGLLSIMQNRFTKLDDETAAAARSILGDDAVTTTATYSFGAKFLEQHKDIIVKALNALPIADKTGMLEKTVTHKFTFTLDEIPAAAAKAKLSIEQVMEITKPVQQLKGRGEE